MLCLPLAASRLGSCALAAPQLRWYVHEPVSARSAHVLLHVRVRCLELRLQLLASDQAFTLEEVCGSCASLSL